MSKLKKILIAGIPALLVSGVAFAMLIDTPTIIGNLTVKGSATSTVTGEGTTSTIPTLSSTHITSQDIRDLSGNKYPTSTSGGGLASTTPFTVGNITIVSSSGALSTYAGSNCTTGSVATGLSASGTMPCVTTSTILTGYVTSTGANPTATIGTSAVNGTANTFIRSDGAPALGTQFASSSVTMNLYDATTTLPYKYAKWRVNKAITLAGVSCDEYAAATTTIELFRATALATTTVDSDFLASIQCGINGTSTTSLATSSVAADNFVVANVSSTAGTPTWTALNIYYKTQ